MAKRLTNIAPDERSGPPPLAAGQADLIDRRLAVLAGVLSAEPGTSERRRLVEAAAIGLGQSPRTVYRLLGRYENFGENGLGRARPANAGKPRVVITRQFDREFRKAGYDEALLTRLRGELDDILAGFWKSEMQANGHRRIGRYAAKKFERTCRQLGVVLPTRCYALPRRTVERFRYLRIVDIYRRDRKAYSDWSAPRPWTAHCENWAGSLALRRGDPEERLRLLHRGFPAEGAMRS